MSLFLQHIQNLYSIGEYSQIVDELQKFEKDSQKSLPKCIFKELKYALSNTYRKIRNENVFPIRFLWFFELKEQVVMGVFMPLERSYYNPELLYERWMRCISDDAFRRAAEEANVFFDLNNKAISLTRGWVLIGNSFIEDLMEIEQYWGEQLKVTDEETGKVKFLFVEYKKKKHRNSRK